MDNFEIIGSENILTKSKDSIVNLVLHTLKENKQVLVFNNSKNSSEATAERIANSISIKDLGENEKELEKLSNRISKTLSIPTRQCKRLSKCILKGVAFHHSGLLSKQRNLVEDAFRAGLIKVISATPTLSAGLDLPAYKVIIKDYKRYSSRGFNDIPILEYLQMSGRAGRPGYEDIGKAVLHVKDENEISRVVPKYVFGKSEEIFSKLAVEPTLKMYVLSLVSMDVINSKDEIKEFFSNTLYGFQFQDLEALHYNIFRVLDILKNYGFVMQSDNYYQVTSLGKKVSELYLNPDTADFFLSHLKKIINTFSTKFPSKDNIFALIVFICQTTEMRPLFRVKKVQSQDYMQRADEVAQDLFVQYDPFEQDFEDFLNVLKTSDILFDWINEAPEEYICEKYSITPGELRYKCEVIDWLLYSIEEFCNLKKEFYVKNYINKLRIRFKAGVKEELLVFVTLSAVGRVRARKLFKAGLKNLADLRSCDFYVLSKAVGDKLAIKIKKQVIGDQYEIDSKEISSKHLKPNEIKAREVLDIEVEEFLENEEEFGKDVAKAEEKQKKLSEFF